MVYIPPELVIAGVQAGFGTANALIGGSQKETAALTNNLIQNAAIEDANRRTKQAWKAQLDLTEKQFEYNKGSADRAYSATQLKQNEQLEAFLMQRRGILKTLMQVKGTYGAREVYGNTNKRLEDINTEGSAGYAMAQLTDNLERFSLQTNRDLAEIGRQWQFADAQAAANITVPPALQTAIPAPDLTMNRVNTALQIGSSFAQAAGTFMALSPPGGSGAGAGAGAGAGSAGPSSAADYIQGSFDNSAFTNAQPFQPLNNVNFQYTNPLG